MLSFNNDNFFNTLIDKNLKPDPLLYFIFYENPGVWETRHLRVILKSLLNDVTLLR